MIPKVIPTLKSDRKDNTQVHKDEQANDNNGFFTPNNKIDFSNVAVEPLFEVWMMEQAKTGSFFPVSMLTMSRKNWSERH